MPLDWKKRCLLEPDDVPPSRPGWEVVGVINPGAALVDERVVLLLRVAERPAKAQTRALCDLFPHGRLDVSAVYAGKDRACRGRHNAYDAYQMIELIGAERPKMHGYGDLLRALLADQIAWLRDRNHPRRITADNGRDSLALACAATALL